MSMVRRDPYFGGILTNTPLTSASCHQIRMVPELMLAASRPITSPHRMPV